MVICSICGKENDDLAVTCVSCRSFVQGKVDTLDLFSTIWGLMESPGRTFRRIAMARSKNYVVLLATLFGVYLAYTVLWFKHLGNQFQNLAIITGMGLAAGPVLGILFTLFAALLIVLVSRLFRGKGKYRNTLAVTAYATFPLAAVLVLVFPVKIAIFGIFLFGTNPPPAVINPPLYYALLGFDGLAALWTWVLLLRGIAVANQTGLLRAVVPAAVVPLLIGAAALVVRSL
jgi:hypothetical protein